MSDSNDAPEVPGPAGVEAVRLPDEKPRSGKKVALITAGVVLLAGVGGAAAWGFSKLSGGGPGAAAVFPATTVSYVALDLDPSAGQKIEAFKTLRKFPELDSKLGEVADDLREIVVDGINQAGSCNIDFGEDVKPWIGDKLGVGLVDGKDEPTIVIALGVQNESKARAGLEQIFAECVDADFGLAFEDGFAIVGKDQTVVDAVVADARESSLADDADYTAMLDELGTIGIATFYQAPGFPDFVGDLAGDDLGVDEDLLKQMEGFEGAAATVRFASGTVELTGVSKGDYGQLGDTSIAWAGLPATTIVAGGFTLPQGWLDAAVKQADANLGLAPGQSIVDEIDVVPGLTLPEDIELFLGSGITVALDGESDFGALTEFGDPAALQAGIILQSKKSDVERVITALSDLTGLGDVIHVGGKDGHVTLALDPDYGQTLADGAKADLAGNKVFRDTVPEAARAAGGLFVDFDGADNWLDRLVADNDAPADVRANVEPLSALGFTVWNEGDVMRASAKLRIE